MNSHPLSSSTSSSSAGHTSPRLLTPSEFLSQRRDRIVSMIHLYRAQYMQLRSLLHKRYSAFQNVRQAQLSSLVSDPSHQTTTGSSASQGGASALAVSDTTVKIKLPRIPEEGGAGSLVEGQASLARPKPIVGQKEYEAPSCSKSRCNNPVIPLTHFCINHILSDEHQKMWIPCAQKTCKCPIIRNGISRFCPLHQKTARNNQTLKRERSEVREDKERTRKRTRKTASGTGVAVEIKVDYTNPSTVTQSTAPQQETKGGENRPASPEPAAKASSNDGDSTVPAQEALPLTFPRYPLASEDDIAFSL
eukprot:ANDGO_07110.mRNA.1 hypothetical protein